MERHEKRPPAEKPNLPSSGAQTSEIRRVGRAGARARHAASGEFRSSRPCDSMSFLDYRWRSDCCRSVHMKRPALPLALLVAIVGAGSGCSWVFVQPLRDRYEYERGDFPVCTSSQLAPIVDTLFTLTNVGSAIYVAGEDNVTNKGTAVTAGLLVGAVWLSSAIYGYSKTSDCREAKEEADYRPRRLMRPRAPPPPVGYPLPPPAPQPSVTPSPASPGQQEDDDDPGHPRPPKPSPPPSQKPDAPRFGG